MNSENGNRFCFSPWKRNSVEELVRAYSDSLVRYSNGIVRNEAAAEDIAADAFAVLLVKQKQFNDETHLRAYLYKTVRNRSLSYLRKHRKTVALEEAVLPQENGELLAEMRERDRILHTCMQKLPSQYHDVLRLIYFEGFSAEELELVLGKSRKQIYNLLARAKASLKERYLQEGIEYEDV